MRTGLEAGSGPAPLEGGSWGGWRGGQAQLSCAAPIHPRSDASREELAELAQQANPEEIELGEDEDEDEMDLEPNEVRLEQQSVPAAVFGSLKED